MNDDNCEIIYDKYEPTEDILPGDVISIVPNTNLVTRAISLYRKQDRLVVGICKQVVDNQVYVVNTGVIDVTVQGIICVGDRLTASDTPGVATAIRYPDHDEPVFRIRSIGKVIGLYDVYNRAKVLLDIE